MKLLSSTWAAKASTKYEVYLLLVTEVKAYLPALDTITICMFQLLFLILFIDFLKDLINGRKKYVKQDKVAYCFVPQYEGLGLKELYSHIDEAPNLQLYFPSLQKERARIPKQWIVNVLATLVGDDFQKWVKVRIDRRNERVAIKDDKFIEVDPDIAAAFQNASSISLSKGSAHQMLQM